MSKILGLALSVLLLLLVGYVGYVGGRPVAEERWRSLVKVTGELLAEAAAGGDFVAPQRSLKQLMKEPGARYAIVTDPQGKVLLSTGKGRPPGSQLSGPTPDGLQRATGPDGGVELRVPLRLHDKTWAVLRVGISSSTALVPFWLAGLLGLGVVGVALTLLLSSPKTPPLEEVEATASPPSLLDPFRVPQLYPESKLRRPSQAAQAEGLQESERELLDRIGETGVVVVELIGRGDEASQETFLQVIQLMEQGLVFVESAEIDPANDEIPSASPPEDSAVSLPS